MASCVIIWNFQMYTVRHTGTASEYQIQNKHFSHLYIDHLALQNIKIPIRVFLDEFTEHSNSNNMMTPLYLVI